MTNQKVQSDIGGGVEVAWAAVHKNAKGELICGQLKRGRWFNYFLGRWDDKRAVYCEQHRNDPVPYCFRAGQFSIKSILFTFKLMAQGVWHGL
jgi:hypothetical protein